MVDIGFTHMNRIGVDKYPTRHTHIVHGVNDRIELFQFPIISFKPIVSPEAFLFAEVKFNGYFITEYTLRSNKLAILFNFGSVGLCT